MFNKESVQISTFLFNDRNVEQMMAVLDKYNFRSIEYFGMDDCHWKTGDSAAVVNSLAKKYCIHSKSMHLTVEPITDESKRKIAMSRMIECILFASAIGAEKVVMHATLRGKEINEKNKCILSQSVKLLGDISAVFSMPLLIENNPAFGYELYGSTIEDLLDIYDRANCKNLYFCYDTGHARVNGKDIFQEFAMSRGLITLIHISDNFGMRGDDFKLNDAHLPPFEGDLPWAKLMKLFFDYPVMLDLVMETSNRATKNDTPEQVLERTLCAIDKLIAPYVK